MTTPAEIQEQVRTLEQGLSDDDLVELWLAEAQRPGRDRQLMLRSLLAKLSIEVDALLQADLAKSVPGFALTEPGAQFSSHPLAGGGAESGVGPAMPSSFWYAHFHDPTISFGTALPSTGNELTHVHPLAMDVLAHSHQLTDMNRDLARQLGGEPRVVLESLDQWELAQLQGEAIRTVWQEPMLTPGVAAESLGAKPTNREKVRRLRGRSVLLGLPHDHAFLYPAFQFDVRRRSVFAEVETVNRMLNAADDPWGVASWWIGQHDRLDARPMDLVGHGRVDDLVVVAEAVLEPVG